MENIENHIKLSADAEEINKIIEENEKELKELKLKYKGLNKEKITRLKVVKPKEKNISNNPRKNVEKKELIKKCILCKIEKPLDEFVINYKYNSKKEGEKSSIKFKNKCLNCYKETSKKYYEENKKRVLDMLANKYEKVIKKKYNIKINFNTLEELENEFNILKEQFLKGEVKEVKRKSKKDKKGGDGGSPANTSVSN